jgi:hypothetical protein
MLTGFIAGHLTATSKLKPTCYTNCVGVLEVLRKASLRCGDGSHVKLSAPGAGREAAADVLGGEGGP